MRQANPPKTPLPASTDPILKPTPLSPALAIAWAGFFSLAAGAVDAESNAAPPATAIPAYFSASIAGFSSAYSSASIAADTAASIAAESAPDTVRMVVEIPAGTTDKIEYDPATGQFELDRVIDYLPYPANYGFLEGTLGGDGDPLDAILLSRRLPTGSLVSGLPVAAILLTDRGEPDEKVLVIPADRRDRLNSCATWECLTSEHPDLVLILETWFQHYKGPGAMRFDGWAGTQATRELIRGYSRP